MKIGIIWFHDWWTDIMNCFALIDYYYMSHDYDKLYVLTIIDAKELFQFYIREKNNIELLYYSREQEHNDPNAILIQNNIIYDNNNYYFYLIHGGNDNYRNDHYKNTLKNTLLLENHDAWVDKYFYENYDIDPYVRFTHFNLNRDLILENNTYNTFIKTHGEKYILTHEIEMSEIKNKENTLAETDNTINCVNLNRISNIYFDYIKVLENAIEIHLLDSSWAALIYILDYKYGLFKNKNIYVYAKRDYIRMFTSPTNTKLDNWTIIR